MARQSFFSLLILIFLSGQAFAQARDTQANRGPRRGTASISGVVLSADSGRPLRLARVTATSSDSQEGRVTTTDEGGRYVLPELSAGRYVVTASKAGFISVNFGQSRPLRPGKRFELKDGERLRDIDFRLSRGSAITGRVLDQEGEPLVGATVRALRSRTVQGQPRIDIAGSAETDDRGVFRIFNLQPGTYFVSATASMRDLSGSMSVMFTSSSSEGAMMVSPYTAMAPDGSNANITYTPTYYPGVTSLAGASPVNLPLSQEAAGIDFTLLLVPAARVTGMVLGPNGAAANGMVVLVPEEARGAAGQSFTGRTNRDGTFLVSNVPPGRYIAIARTSGGRGNEANLVGIQSVSVSPGLVSGLTIAVGPGATLMGTVTYEGTAAPSAADMSGIRVTLSVPSGSEIPGFGVSDSSRLRGDGSFSVQNAMPGPRTIQVSNLPRGWSLKGIYADGRDVTDGAFELRQGDAVARVQIVITDRGSEVSGTVTDGQDHPLQDITVIAFPPDSQSWRPMSRFIQAVRTDKDGSYTLRGLPAGEYLLRAVDDVDQGEWYDPAFLESLRKGADHVLLKDADKKSQDLKVSPVTTRSSPDGGFGLS